MDLNISYTYLNNLDKEKPVVVAVSGGVDSMVLLHTAISLGFKVVIAHVNHHKREQSQLEQEYIESFGKEHNIPVKVLNYHYENDNFQAEAHNKRYEFFINAAKEFDASCILTAHHAMDNLETILMNIIKGSNIYGYAGIKECLDVDGILVIRPLLRLMKSEIYDYAKENNITFFEDSSNAEDDYLRNRIRHNIIPLMLKENPNLSSSVENYSKQLFSAFDFIREKSIAFVGEDLKFKTSAFKNLSLTEQKDVINYLLEQNEVLSSNNKINDIIGVISNSKPNLTYNLGENVLFVKAYDECYISKPDSKPMVYEVINKYDTLIINNYGSFYFRKKVKDGVKYSMKVSNNEIYPLTIRNRVHGDKLIIGEGHKKLKDFLIDKKVPMEQRDKLLVVTNGNGEIIWVIGYYQKKCVEEDALSLIFEEKYYE